MSARRTKPIVAAVNGAAYGGGCELALACELAVADPSATFCLPEVKRGIVAGAGGMVSMPSLVGPRAAMEMLLTGDPIGADQALELGLVNAISKPGAVVDCAAQLAARVAANAPLAVRATRAAALSGLGVDDPQAWEHSRRLFEQIGSTADVREGTPAFIEKRPARWTAR